MEGSAFGETRCGDTGGATTTASRKTAAAVMALLFVTRRRLGEGRATSATPVDRPPAGRVGGRALRHTEQVQYGSTQTQTSSTSRWGERTRRIRDLTRGLGALESRAEVVQKLSEAGGRLIRRMSLGRCRSCQKLEGN